MEQLPSNKLSTMQYTFATRLKHNLQQLIELNSKMNPTTIIKTIGTGNKGNAITSHFLNEAPKSTMLCVGATVSLQGCNFQPLWGLYNGVCGTVKEIIFDKDQSPNFGATTKISC